MLLHPEWMSVAVRGHSIIYDFSAPYRSPIDLPITPMMLYGLTILVPLFLLQPQADQYLRGSGCPVHGVCRGCL